MIGAFGASETNQPMPFADNDCERGEKLRISPYDPD
jgi:hypothetical protein